jgi:hypothetical protein
MSEKLGDGPIEPEYFRKMNGAALALDHLFNGEASGDARETGFVLLVFPFDKVDCRCNFISNGADRKDVVKLFREFAARFEEQPEMWNGGARQMSDLEDLRRIVANYESLIMRAIAIATSGPFSSSVEWDNNPYITLENDDVVLSWNQYESDYYGGGYLRDEEARFPIKFLLMPDEELTPALQSFSKEKREQAEKVRRAQDLIAAERAEAYERAEFARLSKKYGAPK